VFGILKPRDGKRVPLSAMSTFVVVLLFGVEGGLQEDLARLFKSLEARLVDVRRWCR
jgi:hypothetical protein